MTVFAFDDRPLPIQTTQLVSCLFFFFSSYNLFYWSQWSSSHHFGLALLCLIKVVRKAICKRFDHSFVLLNWNKLVLQSKMKEKKRRTNRVPLMTVNLCSHTQFINLSRIYCSISQFTGDHIIQRQLDDDDNDGDCSNVQMCTHKHTQQLSMIDDA